jgi:hypothetical protein
MQELTTIEIEVLDTVNGGVDWGKVHTVIQQASNCAGVAFFPGFLAGGP